VKSNFNLKLT